MIVKVSLIFHSPPANKWSSSASRSKKEKKGLPSDRIIYQKVMSEYKQGCIGSVH